MYARILVPIDGSVPSALGLAEAIRLARVLRSKLRILHVIGPAPLGAIAQGAAAFPQALASIEESARHLIDEAAEHARHEDVEVDTTLVETLTKSPGAAVIDEAQSWQADLIVCGTHGRHGLEYLLMGSDAGYILRHAPVPVLLVRAASAPAHPPELP